MGSTVDYNQIPIKNAEEISLLREAGRISAKILEDIAPHVQPGVTKAHLNTICKDLIENKYNAEVDREDLTGYDSSSFASVSFSHNDIAFNGEASNVALKKGDVFGIDVSLKKNGWCGDTSRQWIIGGDSSAKNQLLVAVGYQAMCLGIQLAKPGAKVQDIARTVQKYVESFGFSMLRVGSGTGHSIGKIHADGWHIPFYEDPRNEGRVLMEGMVITIEPFLCAGKSGGVRLDNTTKTAATADGSTACYWEHVVAITSDGCEILDLREGEDPTFYGDVPTL